MEQTLLHHMRDLSQPASTAEEIRDCFLQIETALARIERAASQLKAEAALLRVERALHEAPLVPSAEPAVAARPLETIGSH